MIDQDIINRLATLCEFHHTMEDGACTSISFYDENNPFGNTIRKHPFKIEVLKLASQLPNLKYFNARKSRIGNIPKFVSKSFEFIDLSCNDLEFLPDWILDQKNLKYLSAGANRLREISYRLCHLPLETLKLHKNMLTSMPCVNSDIRSLNLYLNRIPSISPWIKDLDNLETFAFGVTEMTKLPDMSDLKNLRWLTLTVNKIQSFPDWICSLDKLEGLQLAKNQIDKLPEDIGKMNLKALTLYSNKISKLPESFYDLKLDKLNLAKNNLKGEDQERVSKVFGSINFIST